jgi:glc operon protein GlcG
MDSTRATLELTHSAALKILTTCVEYVEAHSLPAVNIAIASRGGQIIGSISMTEAYFLSSTTAQHKALTAASHRVDTRRLPDDIAAELALASQGRITKMAGGLPVWVGGVCVAGVGVGGASDEEDIAIAVAGIHAVGGSTSSESSLSVGRTKEPYDARAA